MQIGGRWGPMHRVTVLSASLPNGAKVLDCKYVLGTVFAATDQGLYRLDGSEWTKIEPAPKSGEA